MMAAASTSANIALAPTRRSASVHSIAGRRIVQETPDWHSKILKRMSELLQMPRNWNGYGADPISEQTASFALSMLHSACPRESSLPQVVPGVDGDLQVEWHSLEYDIELHVREPSNVLATRYFGDECQEVELSNDFTIVAEWLEDMERAIAARATAG